jgi:hypothetical protein
MRREGDGADSPTRGSEAAEAARPNLLLWENPRINLEIKFSMKQLLFISYFCILSALGFGQDSISTTTWQQLVRQLGKTNIYGTILTFK